MSASVNDKFVKGAKNWVGAIGAGGVSDTVVTTIPLVSTTNLPTDTAVEIVIDRVDANGTETPTKMEVVKGVVSSTNIIDCLRGVEGTAQAHSAGAIVEVMLTASMWNGKIDAILEEHNQDGSHKIQAFATLPAPEGFLVNGKIVPSVASNNLTVALKTLAGTDPSATDPVYVMIGGVLRTITAALSVTKNAGTNWCNAGSAELATKEIDYFAYLGYNATDGVVLGFSRIPSANLYSDFSATTTNEKYCAISTITNAAAGDNYVNIGRFAATLSASAGYTWSVPNFTASNLIQRPIYETRWLDYVPRVYGTGGSAGTYAQDVDFGRYKLCNDAMDIITGLRVTNLGSWTGEILYKLPIATNMPTNMRVLNGTVIALSGLTTKLVAMDSRDTSAIYWSKAIYDSYDIMSALAANDLFYLNGRCQIK